MTLVIDSTTPGAEGLCNRLGAILYALELVNTSRDPATSGAWPAAVDDVYDLFAGVAPDLLATITPLTAARDAGAKGLDAIAKALRTSAENLVRKMCYDAGLVPAATLEESLLAWVAAMKAGGYYFDANTVAGTPTQTSLTGNGLVVVDVKDGDGFALQNLLAETLRIRVLDTSTAGAEVLQVLGEAAESDKLSYRWPKGSGANGRFTSIAAGSDGIITNGTFETFTVANTPDGWTLEVGAAGTDFLSEASTVYEGAKSLKIVGDGSTLPRLKQGLDTDLLVPKQPYAVVAAMRMSSAPSTGVLTLDAHNGSGVITDEKGTNQSTTIDLTTLGTSFVLKSFVFRLPDPLPAAVYLRLHTSTAIETAKSLFIDSIRIIPLARPAVGLPGGVPFVGFASGSTAWSGDDGDPAGTTVFKIVTTNNRASKWLLYLDRVFDLIAKGLRFPVTGDTGATTLVNDSLIG
jgi:hypothetical protein